MTHADQIRTESVRRALRSYLLETPPRPAIAAPDRDRLAGDVDAFATWLDSTFRVPGLGLRFGWDALLGLVPGVGDTLASLASLYILHAAARLGVPRATLVRMGCNVGVDYVVGAIPIVGDVFDVFWKSNRKNAALLRRHLAANPVERRRATRGDRLFVGGLIAALVLTLAGSITLAILAASSLWRLFS